MRAPLLLLLSGCAASTAVAPPAEAGLERLRKTSNAYASFHYVAEITDGKQTVRVELGWRSPDRAFLRYGPSYAIYYAGSTARYYHKQGTLVFDAGAELERLRKEYPGVSIGGDAELAFLLSRWEALIPGQGLHAALGFQRLGARLGWLTELAAWPSEGLVFRKDPLEIELRPDGFPARVKAGASAELTAKEVKIDVPLDDALFEPPSKEGLPELPAVARENLVRSLEDAWRRWALETDATDRTLEVLVRADVARLYDPPKMLEILKESIDKSVATWKAENPNAAAELLREKLKVDQGKTLGSVDVMEKEILATFDRFLDRTFRGMIPVPPRAYMQDVASRWQSLAAREVERQIRGPFERAFEERLRN